MTGEDTPFDARAHVAVLHLMCSHADGDADQGAVPIARAFLSEHLHPRHRQEAGDTQQHPSGDDTEPAQ